MPRSLHRAGRRWVRAKAEMHAARGYICHICGHDGAGEADHLVPLAVDPHQPIDPDAMRPAHGSNYPCPVCPGTEPGRGRCCNQERGTKGTDQLFTPRLTW